MRRLFPARFAIALLVLLAGGVPARAHVVDEYLQATRVGIGTDRIDVEIDLTAGIAIASGVFASIDADRDGRISESEQDRYAQHILSAISLSVDGRRTTPALIARTFPPFEQMSLGLGTIRLRASVRASAGTGRHQLVYDNLFHPESSAYLVNALMPNDARIELGPPRRDAAQRRLSIDFDVASDGETHVIWSAAAFGTIGLLMLTRRRRELSRMALTFAVAIAASSGLACAAHRSPASTTPLNAQFTLAPGDTSAIAGTELFVRFDRVVQDSRCPTDVACIQAGEATISITVRQPGKMQSYLLHTSGPGPLAVTHDGVTISLEELAPRPVSSRATPARMYRATLRASR